MNFIDFDNLLYRMATLEQAAFLEFEDSMRDIVMRWLLECGLTEAAAIRETPNCLLALAVMVVQRRTEIENGRVLTWLRLQTRNLVVDYWRETDQKSPFSPKLTAKRAREQVSGLDGSSAAYTRASKTLGVPPGWLRRRHRHILAKFPFTG